MKLKKRMKILTILALLLVLLNSVCFAKIDTGTYKPEDLTGSDYDQAFELAQTIVGALTIVGTVIAIVGILILGIKYMLGSVEEKAEYKKTMIPYIIGCVFIFAISQIVSIIYSLVTQI